MKPSEPPEQGDRRRLLRFGLVLPVTFNDTTGWTRDVSASGAFFTFRDRPDRPLEIGARIRVGVVLEHGDPRGGPVAVRCEGTVVRVERAPEAVGVAVSFDAYQFDMPAA